MQPNPYAPPATPLPYAPYYGIDAPQHGSGHITANFVIMIVLGVLHMVWSLGALMNMAQFLTGDQPVEGDAAYQVGNIFGIFGSAAWGLLGLVWTPLNAYGLYTRRPWGRTSSLVYYAISVLTCCCTPFGIYGLVSLTRGSVSAQFR